MNHFLRRREWMSDHCGAMEGILTGGDNNNHGVHWPAGVC